MKCMGATVLASAMAVAPPQVSRGKPSGPGTVGSVAMSIRNRHWPRARLRRTGLAPLVTLMLVAPSQSSAQVLQSFEELALRVNLDDQLQVGQSRGAGSRGKACVTITSNAYCALLGIHPPRIEDAGSSSDANYYSLLLVAPLERGAPLRTVPRAYGPLPAADHPVIVSALDEVCRDGVPDSWSVQRVAVAVLDAHESPMSGGDVMAFVAARSRWKRRFAKRKSLSEIVDVPRSSFTLRNISDRVIWLPTSR